MTCFFYQSGRDLAKYVAVIADELGLDSKQGLDPIIERRIEQRLQAFVSVIAPSHEIDITISNTSGGPNTVLRLCPSNLNGISSQVLPIGSTDADDGKTISSTA